MFENLEIKGFSALLAQVRAYEGLYGAPAHSGLVQLATLAGRLPLRQALESLTPREKALFLGTFAHNEIVLVHPESGEIGDCNYLVTHSPFGKLSLYYKPYESPPSEEHLVGGLKIPDWLVDRIEDECATEEFLEQQERRRLDELLIGWESEGLIDEKIDRIMDWVERIDNVFVYIGRKTFSRADIGTNTLMKDGVLERLKRLRTADWSPEERLFVVGVSVLFSTGRYPIGEFNGKQFSALELRRWLIQKLTLYSNIVAGTCQEGLSEGTLMELAEYLGSLERQADRSGWTRFRRIKGVTLTKEEHVVSPEEVESKPIVLPELLRAFASQTLNLELDLTVDPEKNVEKMTSFALREGGRTLPSRCAEQIVSMIVLSAVLEADADYGMSSSLRNLSRLRGTEESRIVGALSLKKPDFFCCVLPSPRLMNRLSDDLVEKIIHASAKRMQFNRWHFIVGNFTREEIPSKRHYYVPPTMPDIAEWSDLHHGGHVNASVRYTIRAPGPALWEDPLLIFGHPYRGIYDIRLVRMEGPPFGKRHMWCAVRHCILMGAFWRAVRTFVEQHDGDGFTIVQYTNDWYKTKAWRDVLEEHLTLDRSEM